VQLVTKIAGSGLTPAAGPGGCNGPLTYSVVNEKFGFFI